MLAKPSKKLIDFQLEDQESDDEGSANLEFQENFMLQKTDSQTSSTKPEPNPEKYTSLRQVQQSKSDNRVLTIAKNKFNVGQECTANGSSIGKLDLQKSLQKNYCSTPSIAKIKKMMVINQSVDQIEEIQLYRNDVSLGSQTSLKRRWIFQTEQNKGQSKEIEHFDEPQVSIKVQGPRKQSSELTVQASSESQSDLCTNELVDSLLISDTNLNLSPKMRLFQSGQRATERTRKLLSALLNENLTSEIYNRNLQKFIGTTIPTDQVFKFEVHVYRNLLKTEYELWVEIDSQDLRQIARAFNADINLDKSVFTIEKIDLQNKRQFVGSLESNFLRDTYNLYGLSGLQHGGADFISEQVLLLTTISTKYERTLYIATDRGQWLRKEENGEVKDLQSMYKEQVAGKQIQRLKTSSSIPNDEKLYGKLGIRQSAKTLGMIDSDGVLKLFVGKKASKQYRVLSGEGLSPLTVLSTVIAHVES